MNKKQIRKDFKADVFKRDNYACKCCGEKYSKEEAEEFLDAHHITDRNEMENGGYVKENGISLCKYERSDFFQGPIIKGVEANSCHMKAEKFHITEGKEWEPGMHPDDLYKLIGSSKEKAIEASKKI